MLNGGVSERTCSHRGGSKKYLYQDCLLSEFLGQDILFHFSHTFLSWFNFQLGLKNFIVLPKNEFLYWQSQSYIRTCLYRMTSVHAYELNRILTEQVTP